MAARLNVVDPDGGAAALARARARAAAITGDEITAETAAGLARVSLPTILLARKRGDLKTVGLKNGYAAFSAEAVRAWAREKRLIV
jgi:hypothetical protein